MRLSSLVITAVPFAIAAALSFAAAGGVVSVIEDTSELSVRRSLDDNGLSWAEVHANGLQVYLTGTAPSEALRFKAISTAGSIVDAARVIDDMKVTETASLKAPRFSIEILRNDSGLSLIGLVPADMDRAKLVKSIQKAVGGAAVSDLLQAADYDPPEGWDASVAYAVQALKDLPRSKVSVAADQVSITAMAESRAAKRKLEAELTRRAGNDVVLQLSISAPRPVLTPFTLRLSMDEDGTRFDACSADSTAAAARITAAAQAAGLANKTECVVGLGVPSPRWAEAAEKAIAALSQLGGGSVTFTDADISLIAAPGIDADLFDQVIGELENSLPDVFSLHSDLPVPETQSTTEAPEFTATLSPEGQVQLRGRVGDTTSRFAAETFAHARFGTQSVHTAARLDESLPRSWSLRVLAGLEALSHLSSGAVIVTPEELSLTGRTGKPEASALIAALLSEKLGEGQRFDINVEYLEKLDPVASLPTPEECETRIATILSTRKINFEPGSDTPDAGAQAVMDDIATILAECGEIRIEIQGHTDSQGRESMNQALSQSRAQAVLNALRERRILTSSYVAKGYGESQPIADNGTEEGREANRRIEFKLIRPEASESQEVQTTLESVASEAIETEGESSPQEADEGAEEPSGDE